MYNLPMNEFGETPKPRSLVDMDYNYRLMGLETSVGKDEGDKHYMPHYHDHDVHLFVFRGGIKMQMGDGDWQIYEEGGEISIPAQTVHEAIVEPNGWIFLVGIPNDAQHPFQEFPPTANLKS